MRELRVLAFDPGIVNAGLAVIDIMDGSPVILHAENFDLYASVSQYPTLEYYQGDVIARCHATRDKVSALLREFSPDYFAYEAQFVGGTGNVSSYTRTIRSIEYAIDAVVQHRKTLPIVDVGASEVKKFMGVKGGDDDKNNMLYALQNEVALGRLSYGCITPMTELSQHAIDSICIGLFSFNIYLGRYAYAT